MVRVAILTLGTRGDVQPYLALGRELRRRGHEVTVAAPDNFGAWASAHGFEFAPLGLDFEAFLRRPDVRQALAGQWWRLVSLWREVVAPTMRGMFAASWEAARDADVLVYHPKVPMAVDIAEATGAGLVSAVAIPIFPTGAFPPPIWSGSFGAKVNRWLYKLFEFSHISYRRSLNRWRRETLGLGPSRWFTKPGFIGDQPWPRLCGVSPAVLPAPSDWDAQTVMTGYWFLDEEEAEREPDPGLQRFLDDGEPLVYVGFGSMTTPRPDATARAFLDGARRAGVRLLIARGWGGLEAREPWRESMHLHVLDAAPHRLLFPRVAGVVHHGGAGTTGAGLRAGRPTWICPVSVDQPFWGRRVHELGCGPEPVRLRRVRADTVAAALDDLVQNRGYRERARELGRAVARENGVAVACDWIERAARRGLRG